MSEHQDLREWAAAYVLGSLEPDERSRFESHMAQCDECRQQVTALAPLPGLLGRLESIEDVPDSTHVADRAAERVREEWAGLDRSRKRWRMGAVAAAMVAVATFAGFMLATPDEVHGTVVAFVADTPVQGQIEMYERGWGTEIEIELSGLPEREKYLAWAVSTEDEWEQICAWGATDTGDTWVAGATSLTAGELKSVVITAEDPSDTIAVATTEGGV